MCGEVVAGDTVGDVTEIVGISAARTTDLVDVVCGGGAGTSLSADIS